VLFRARERLVHQRTELVNALRGILYEFGHVVPQGIGQLKRIEAILDTEHCDLPVLVREECRDLLAQISEKTARIERGGRRPQRSWQRRPTRRVGCRRCPGSGR
jgi:transposase